MKNDEKIKELELRISELENRINKLEYDIRLLKAPVIRPRRNPYDLNNAGFSTIRK